MFTNRRTREVDLDLALMCSMREMVPFNHIRGVFNVTTMWMLELMATTELKY